VICSLQERAGSRSTLFLVQSKRRSRSGRLGGGHSWTESGAAELPPYGGRGSRPALAGPRGPLGAVGLDTEPPWVESPTVASPALAGRAVASRLREPWRGAEPPSQVPWSGQAWGSGHPRRAHAPARSEKARAGSRLLPEGGGSLGAEALSGLLPRGGRHLMGRK